MFDDWWKEILSLVGGLLATILAWLGYHRYEYWKEVLGRAKVWCDTVMKRKHWAAEQERYTLHAVDSGAFAYALKPGVEATEPPHWLCPQCFHQQRKSILQFDSQPPIRPGQRRGDYRRWVCSACEHALMVEHTKNPANTKP